MLDNHDHRRIGNRLDLFHFQEEAPGMAFWHPRGFAVLAQLEDAVRREMRRQQIREVRTPQLMRVPVWEASGHWSHFREYMFAVDDEPPAALKPVSCPAHLMMARRMALSYRELPLRIGEIGLVHRNEQSGALHGLLRLRQFSQDDGHILCAPEHVVDEVARFCQRLHAFYAAFDLKIASVGFSSRPEDRVGSDAEWDEAERTLAEAAERAGLSCIDQPGEGAFYGPKLEFVLVDRFDRQWQCGTIQLDLAMPARFDVSYVDEHGERKRPALLHRAVLGSLERFLGMVLESYAGALPPWLAPEQVLIVPIAAAQEPYAREVAEALCDAGLRARLDARNESLSRKVVLAHEEGFPFVAVVGKREARDGSVALRKRDGSQEVLPLEGARAALLSECEPPL
ncbi:MAG: threonine--tRNA ligase [Myxococcales bacterium]|nr:threonine--tRNA ligase [Myxococcales bacterium]